MIIFIFLVAFSIISPLICKKIFLQNWKKIYCKLMWVATMLIMGLRSIYVAGVDTRLVYIPKFEAVQSVSYIDLPSLYSKDIVFYLLTKLFTEVCKNHTLYLLAIAAFVTYSFSKFVYKYSKNPLFSYIVYFSLNYYSICFQMLRHAVAISILLFSYDSLINRKVLKFILIVLFASCFHSSAIVFLLAYPIANLKIGLKQLMIISAALGGVFLLRNQILDIIGLVVNTSFKQYVSYGFTTNERGLSITGTLILIVIYLTELFLLFPLNSENKQITMLLNLSVAGIMFMAMSMIIGEFHRISMFFGMSNTILLPNAWYKYNSSDKKAGNIIIILTESFLIFYFLFFGLRNTDLLNYRFFWHD